MISVIKDFTFEACHRLPDYKGDCCRWHGHSYTLSVEVTGYINPETGMVVDFKKLDSIVEATIIKTHDHRTLNDLYLNPTAEAMLVSMAQVLMHQIERMNTNSIPRPELTKLTLWETAKCRAVWRP